MKATRRPSCGLTPAIVAGLIGMLLCTQPLSAGARTRGVTLGDPDTGDNGAKPNASSVVLVTNKSVSRNTPVDAQSSVQSHARIQLTWIWLLIRYGSRLP